MSEKVIGCYYWVKVVRVLQASAEWQPGRFTGVSGDGDARETWDLIGLRSEDGHHHARVIDVGGPVVQAIV